MNQYGSGDIIAEQVIKIAIRNPFRSEGVISLCYYKESKKYAVHNLFKDEFEEDEIYYSHPVSRLKKDARVIMETISTCDRGTHLNNDREIQMMNWLKAQLVENFVMVNTTW